MKHTICCQKVVRAGVCRKEKNMFWLNILPVVVNILFLPFWFIEEKVDFITKGTISLVEMIFNAFIVPVFLLIINFYTLKKLNKPIWQHYIIMIITAIISGAICYINWGINGGNLLNPDGMTVALTQLIIIISVTIITVVSIVIKIVQLLNGK